MKRTSTTRMMKDERLVDEQEKGIRDLTYQPGDPLPPVCELMRLPGCSLATVRQALEILAAYGLARSVPGKSLAD